MGAPNAPVAPGYYHSANQFSAKVELYRGSVSTVYKAVHDATGARVILKCYHKKKMHEKHYHKLEREIRVMVAMRGPYVAELYGWFSDEESIWLVSLRLLSLWNLLMIIMQVQQATGATSQCCVTVQHAAVLAFQASTEYTQCAARSWSHTWSEWPAACPAHTCPFTKCNRCRCYLQVLELCEGGDLFKTMLLHGGRLDEHYVCVEVGAHTHDWCAAVHTCAAARCCMSHASSVTFSKDLHAAQALACQETWCLNLGAGQSLEPASQPSA